MLSNQEIWNLTPTDPMMVQIRTRYFELTGHYGSEDEIKYWYTGTYMKDTPYSTNPEDNSSA